MLHLFVNATAIFHCISFFSIQYTIIQLYSFILKGIVSTIYGIINIYIYIYINNKVFSKKWRV